MKKISKRTYFLFGFFIILSNFIFLSCGDNVVPKPYGYFRIDLPDQHYVNFEMPKGSYQFDKSTLTDIRYRQAPREDEQWLDIVYPKLRAVIHCSYLPIKNNLNELTEENRSIVYKHSVRADAIDEQNYNNPERNVASMLYTLSGNVASPIQFTVTDSVEHFFRGVLYFEGVPNKDSIAPVVTYLHQDVVRMIESFEWKHK